MYSDGFTPAGHSKETDGLITPHGSRISPEKTVPPVGFNVEFFRLLNVYSVILKAIVSPPYKKWGAECVTFRAPMIKKGRTI